MCSLNTGIGSADLTGLGDGTITSAIKNLGEAKVDLIIVDNTNGSSSTVSNDTLTKSLIDSIEWRKRKYWLTPCIILFKNHDNVNEFMLAQDVGFPYFVGIKISYYSASMLYYRKTNNGWDTTKALTFK